MSLAEVEELCDQTVTAAAQLMHCLANIQPARPPAAAATGTGAVLDSLAQLFRQGGLPAATHSHIFYALARLTKPYTSSSRGMGVGVGAKAAGQGERPRGGRGAAGGVESALQRLLPVGLDASRLALPEYSAVDLVTVFSGLAALRVPLSSAWLDAWWEYSRLQLSSCPLPLLCACLRAVRAVEVAVPSLWSQALWEALAELSHTLKLAEVEHLMSSLVASQLRPPGPLLQRLLDQALEQQQQAAAAQASQLLSATPPTRAHTTSPPAATSDRGSNAASGPEQQQQQQQQAHQGGGGEVVVASGRAPRSVRAAAPRQAPLPGAAVRGAGARAGDGSLAAAEPRPAASSQVPDQVPGGGDRAVLLLAEALKHAAHGFDFRPEPRWQQRYLLALRPALTSPWLAEQQRELVAELMRDAEAAQPLTAQ
ncbi:hypothetical protein V8C86DRAFT_3029371 [Haematococcus lacustris]